MMLQGMDSLIYELSRVLAHYGIKAARPPSAARRGMREYERQLRDIYERWSDDLAAQLAEVNADERNEELTAALALLLGRLRSTGHTGLEAAALIGFNTDELSSEAQALLAEAISRNDDFLMTSLIPALRDRLEATLRSEDFLIALAAEEGETMLGAEMDTVDARVGLYAGAWWTLYHNAFGVVAQQRDSRITAYLDPLAQHCSECPLYHSVVGESYETMEDYLAQTGGRVPGEFECVGNCRCWLIEA